jgi:iron complex transport system permease protein
MKKVSVMAILVLILMVALVISAGLGEAQISPLRVVRALIGQGSVVDSLILLQFRLPRIVLAVLVGVSFSVAGAILQALTRNPLATPEMMGISGGANVAAVSVIMLLSSSHSVFVSTQFLPLYAFLGSTTVALILYVFAWKRGVTPYRLILVGIGFFTFTQAMVNLVVLLGPVFSAVHAKTWLTGSIYGINWRDVLVLLPWVVVLFIITLLFSRHLAAHELGESLSIGLGVRVKWERFLLLLLSTGLTGAAVAFVGGIGFVGLIGPHLARRLVGNNYQWLLPASALIGANMVLLADLLGRILLAPREIPAGVFTALIGVPYFLYLLYRSRHVHS